MSKLDIRTALRENGINCEFEGNKGRVLLVTPQMLEQYPAPDESPYPEVEAGEGVVSYLKDGKARAKVILAGAENDLAVMIRDKDGNENRVFVGGLDGLTDAVRKSYELEDAVSPRQEGVLARLRAHAEYVFNSVLMKSRLASPETIGAALAYQLERSRRNEGEDTRLSPEQIDAIATARALRETIGRIRPDHADALVAGDRYVSQGHAHDLIATLGVRPGPMPRAAGSITPAQAGRLVEEVFGAMTKTGIGSLAAMPVSAETFESVRQDMRPGQVKGGFVSVIKERLGDIFSNQMKGYNDLHEIELYTREGADLLLVKDFAGTYVYGWDTDSRKLEIEEKLILGEADVPSEEEIARLREVLADLRYEIGDDELNFDLFADGEELDGDAVDLEGLMDDYDDDLDDDDLDNEDDEPRFPY